MFQKEISRIISYQMMVRETKDHQLTEWIGSITLFPQENGEAYVEINFSEYPVIRDITNDLSYYPIDSISIECFDCDHIPVDGA